MTELTNSTAPAGQQPSRRHERQSARTRALVHCHGRHQTVRIVDFSLGGLQLADCFGVAVGDHVVVELLSRHRMEGKVAWAIAGRIGMQFLESLAVEDPIMVQLSKPGRTVGRA